MNADLIALRERWLATFSFADEQAYLAARVRLHDARSVFLDPDGMLSPWLMVVVRHPTGVIYANQCTGIACEERFIEGYLVPVAASPERGGIDPKEFNDIFHEGEACEWNWCGRDLPESRMQKLASLLQDLGYSRNEGSDRSHSYPMCIDRDRVDQIAEAWIPVETPEGPGVLLYKNCD